MVSLNKIYKSGKYGIRISSALTTDFILTVSNSCHSGFVFLFAGGTEFRRDDVSRRSSVNNCIAATRGGTVHQGLDINN
jgi:hypothetical protein